MKHRNVLRVLLVSAVLVMMLSTSPAFAAPGALRMPGARFGTSRNWSGYAVQTDLTTPLSYVVTDVKGSWMVTTVTATAVNAYSASWIGIDGYSSNTVEQIGTEANWINGQAVYSAWYEMYPKKSMPIRTLTVRPGDVVVAEVSYGAKTGFTLSLTNMKTGKSFTTTQKAGSAKRSSAEWIVEAPWSGGTLPLANFVAIPFTGCSVRINGNTGGINDTRWKNDPLTMYNGATGNNLAVPSTLSLGGTAFSMTWLNLN